MQVSTIAPVFSRINTVAETDQSTQMASLKHLPIHVLALSEMHCKNSKYMVPDVQKILYIQYVLLFLFSFVFS